MKSSTELLLLLREGTEVVMSRFKTLLSNFRFYRNPYGGLLQADDTARVSAVQMLP
jgi:hypothetical protein